METDNYQWMQGTYGERVAATCEITDPHILFDIMCSDPVRETRLAAAYTLLNAVKEPFMPQSYQFADELFSPHAGIIPQPHFLSNIYGKSFPDRRADIVPFIAGNRELLCTMVVFENDTIVAAKAVQYLGLQDLKNVYENVHHKKEGIKSVLEKVMGYNEQYLPRCKPMVLSKPITKSSGLPPPRVSDFKCQLDDFTSRFKETFDKRYFSTVSEDDVAMAIYAMKENEDIELMHILQNLYSQPGFRHRAILKSYHNTLVCIELEDDSNGYHRNAGHLRLPDENENFDRTYFERQNVQLQIESQKRLLSRLWKMDEQEEPGHWDNYPFD